MIVTVLLVKISPSPDTNFCTCHCLQGQEFNDFLNCKFKDRKDSLIRDIVAVGTLDEKLRERTLLEPRLTLTRVVELVQSSDQTKLHVKQLQQESYLKNHSHFVGKGTQEHSI